MNTVVVVNFLVFLFVVRHSALGTLPSDEGFVLRSRAEQFPTTENLWLINLFYTYVSWLSPVAMVLYAVIWQKARLSGPRIGRWLFLTLAIAVPIVGFISLTSKLVASLNDWFTM